MSERLLRCLLALSGVLTTACTRIDVCGAAGSICRVAGNGETGFNGDGRDALQTAFDAPTSVRKGPDGRVYVMDGNNMRLRAIGADGKVTTVAGNGVHGNAIPGVPALESALENPVDFAFLADGTIVLVMLHDPRVLEIGADQKVRVVAGSGEYGNTGDFDLAILARFEVLAAVAVGTDGAIYVADTSTSRVRVVRPGGTIEPFAGTGVAGYAGDHGSARVAQLSSPSALAFDGSGNLLIADSGNHTVRRVGADGTIQTIAGTGVAGFSGDGGPAASAQLDSPQGVTVASDGSIYVSDSVNNRIRRVDANGQISTVAGTGGRGLVGDGSKALSSELSNPGGVWSSGADLYFTDVFNGCIRQVVLGT